MSSAVDGTHLILANGVKMPIIGLGTWQSNDGDMARTLRIALKNGYRLIDTASAYKTEGEIGQVLQEFFKSGQLKREDVFVTTKLFWCFNREKDVEPQIRASLEALQLDYVDLYLVHMPGGLTHDLLSPDNDHRLEDVWRGMEKIYDLKLARAIGVSNANAEQLGRINKMARVPIHDNQVECHLYLNQKELKTVQERPNISMTAYAPLGSPGRTDIHTESGFSEIFSKDKGHSNPLENPIVKRLAAKYGKTPAQILLRQLTQRGICVIPKSTNEKRLVENINIFDFALTDSEVNELLNVEQEPRIFKQTFLEGSVEDPFKDERNVQKD